MHSIDALRDGSLRYVLEVAPSMLRENDQVSDILIERIRSHEESEEGVNALLRLMSLHLQSNEKTTEQLVELLYSSDYRLCIIHHLPKLTYQSKQCIALVLRSYHELLESDGSLVVPILGSLADMPLTIEQQNDVIEMAHAMMDSIVEEDIPAVVRALFAMITPKNGDLVIESIRAQCHQLPTHTLLLVVEVMGRYLRSGSTSLKYVLRAIRNADPLLPIDGLCLLLLLQHDSKAAWSSMCQLGRKCTPTWLESVAVVALESPHNLLTPCLNFCMLLAQSAFHKSTLVSVRSAMIQSSIQTVSFLLQNTRGLGQQEVLMSLLALASQSHKLATMSSHQELRWSVARTAAICIADSVNAIPSYGHLILDTVHQLSSGSDICQKTLQVLDPLCFGLVQLIAVDPSLYALVLLTIQKHILLPSAFQTTAMLLASHLSYAGLLESVDQRTITKWMYRLLHTASMKVIPYICAYLNVQVDKRADQSSLQQALLRRGIVVSRDDGLSITRFIQSLQDGAESYDIYALLDMVHCLVIHTSCTPLEPSILASGLQPLDDEMPDIDKQCQLMVAIAICNGYFHTHPNDAAAIAPHFQTAYDLATLLSMQSTLCLLNQDLVLQLSHLLPIPSVHVIYTMLHQNNGIGERSLHRWQLYGTYLHHDKAKFLPHLPFWLELIMEYGDHKNQPNHAETLLQLYSIFTYLLDDTSIVSAMSPTSSTFEEARETVYRMLKEQAMDQLQDAQAIVPMLDLLVLLSGSNVEDLHDTSELAQSILRHVFPDSTLDLSVWRGYIGRPAAALQHLPSALFLKAPTPIASQTHYLYHAMVTAYALHRYPYALLRDVHDVLNQMVVQETVNCHEEYRSFTQDTFRHAFVSYWHCLLNYSPVGCQVRPSKQVENPYTSIIQLFSLLDSSFGLAQKANLYDALNSFPQKTVVLMLRACQVTCEQLHKCMERCLRWRETLETSDRNGDVCHLSPLLLQMEFSLTTMEQYVHSMQGIALQHMKEAAKPSKTKLQQMVKKQRIAQPMPQIKYMPQILRWIHRTKEMIATNQKRYSIPKGSDLELNDIIVLKLHDRWRGYRSDEDSEEEKEEEEETPIDDEGGFRVLRTDVHALQTPQKQRPNELQDDFGFPSIMIDFKQLKKT